jgi:hypothetical protein
MVELRKRFLEIESTLGEGGRMTTENLVGQVWRGLAPVWKEVLLWARWYQAAS